MAEIFLILALGCAIGAYKAIKDMRTKKEEQNKLKEELGDDYELYMNMREERKRKQQ